MNTELIDFTILGPAFLAGLLVSSTHIPLGQEVLNRGIIFIDLAVAQVAGLGVIVAAAFDWDFYGVATQISAVGAALFATLLLHWIEKKFPEIQEALIGVMFVLAATASILVLAENPHGGEHLKDLLVGQILWVTLDMLWPVAIVYAIVLAIWFSPGEIGRFTFYLVFAVTITASVQLVGVYLVFASLIIPAIASRKLQGMQRLLTSYALAAAAYGAGLILSAIFDFPPGAIIVWCLFFCGLIASRIITWFSPEAT
jgi:zinc/manganese transport system permease protein